MPATPTGKIELLALAVAGGQTVRGWAKAHGVAERTAYRWAAEAEFRAKVLEFRARLIDAAVGRLSRSATRAVAALEAIIAPGSTASDLAKIGAAKAILATLVDLRSHAELAERLAELERRFSSGHALPKPRN